MEGVHAAVNWPWVSAGVRRAGAPSSPGRDLVCLMGRREQSSYWRTLHGIFQQAAVVATCYPQARGQRDGIGRQGLGERPAG